MIFKLNFHLKFSLILIFLCFYFFSNCPAFTEKKETIKSGFYENKPKLFMYNEKYSGIFIDILEEIGKKNNFKIKYTKCEWPECIELLKKGEIDIMPDVAFSLERSRQFNFNNEIVFESFSQIYTKKGIKVERLSDLDGLTIALLEGSIQEKIIVTMMSGFDYRLKVLHVNSYEEAFNLTAQGIVDAAVANHFFGEYFYKWYNLSKTPLVFNPAALHFAAPKNKNTELLEKIDRTLKIMKANPGSVYYKALEKWMERPPVTAVPKYIYFILFLLLIFFISSLGIIILLKTKINKKKLNLQIFKNEFEKSEKKFKNLFETMGLAVVFQNKDQEIILANKEAEYLLGFSFKSVGKKKFNLCKNAVTEDGLPITKINNPFFKASEKGEKTCGLIAGIKTYGNSSLKWVLINSTPEIDPETTPPYGVLSIIEDVTELKIMEEELMKRNKEFEQIFNTVPDAMIYADKNRNILRTNKRFAEIFNYTSDEVKGKNTSFLYKDLSEYEHQGKIRYSEEGTDIIEPYEIQYKRKNQEIFIGETVGSKVKDSRGRLIGMIALIRDVTEKRKFEAMINHSQKIESVGRIAGSIAHDFNNILGIISGYADLILLNAQNLPDIQTHTSHIQEAALKAQKLTRHLLTFSRKQNLNFSKTDINELIKNFREFLSPLLKNNISLYLNLCEVTCCVKADPGQLEQVLMNLAVNSKDAFNKKGTITISTKIIKIPSTNDHLIPLKPGNYVLILFEDNGAGIPKEAIDHLFEPFFTTKPKEKGTGLGLSTAYGIIKQHGGEITVSSVVGKGTIFKIYLPCI